VKKEVSSVKNRSLKESDRRGLELSIPTTAHRGLRMLCREELLDLQIDCPVNTAVNEFACAKLSDIRLDITQIQALIKPILEKLVNTDNNGAFDKIATPLLKLEERIPGVSDFAKQTITLLNIADTLVGKQSGVDTVRAVLKIYRALKTIASAFASSDADGILLADSCLFKPLKAMYCTGGAL
jgi:hypothetical protein